MKNLKLVKPEDVLVFSNNFVSIGTQSAKNIKPFLRIIPGQETIRMYYCGTGFADQPDLMTGGLLNIFLSNKSICAIENMNIDVIESGSTPMCVEVRGIPLSNL